MSNIQKRRRGFCSSLEGIQKINMRMSELGWSVDELAEQVDICSDHLKRFLNPHWKCNKIGGPYVYRIAKVLGLQVTDIVAPQEENSPSNNEKKKLSSIKEDCSMILLEKSKFALNRPLEEAQCQKTLQEPGALVQIKGPPKMGKTIFLDKILSQLKQQGYQTVTFDFKMLGSDVLDRLEDFLKAFCSAVSDRLNLSENLNKYWNNFLSNNYRTTKYFQDYLLPQVSDQFILVLEQVDVVFEHPKIAKDFCNLLASWYREAQSSNETSQIWRRLRLVIVHDTDIYSSLDINHSPLAGLGTVIEFEELTEVRRLPAHSPINSGSKQYEMN